MAIYYQRLLCNLCNNETREIRSIKTITGKVVVEAQCSCGNLFGYTFTVVSYEESEILLEDRPLSDENKARICLASAYGWDVPTISTLYSVAEETVKDVIKSGPPTEISLKSVLMPV